jgi:LysR family cyn operon transcriptional activator
MELRQLRYFVKSAELLNFTEAANLCCITQSTLSQQIKQLENDLGVQLFERIGRKVFLTEEGKDFLPFARQTLADADYAKQRLRDIDDIKTGTIRIGSTFGLSTLLTNLIDKYSSLYPQIKFEVQFFKQDDLIEAVRERKVDFAIAFNLMKKDELIQEVFLHTYHLSAIVSKDCPLAEKESITLTQLKKYKIATPAPGMNARRMFDAMVSESDTQLKPSLEINEIHTLLHLVRTGEWVAILVDSIIIGENDLKAVPFKNNSLPMNVELLYPKGMYLRKAIKVFFDLLELKN